MHLVLNNNNLSNILFCAACKDTIRDYSWFTFTVRWLLQIFTQSLKKNYSSKKRTQSIQHIIFQFNIGNTPLTLNIII